MRGVLIHQDLDMKPVHFCLTISSAVVIVTFCNYFIDRPLALSVKEFFDKNPTWSKYTADIPDVLIYLVCATTFVSFVCYVVRTEKNVVDTVTRFCLHLACVAPLSYLLNSLLKFFFGRFETRLWLVTPQFYGFHWFQGDRYGIGFPSGHMAVFTTVNAALWRIYPRYRPMYLLFLLLLAAALVATNYHFLGDVVGGAYLGILVEAVTYRFLNRNGLSRETRGHR